MTMENCKIIQLPKITDPRGNLSIIEQITQIPFEIKRVHWVYDVPGGYERGGHAYKETEEFVEESSYQNIEAAINWTIKHDMLMQAYPLAEEYVIMRVADFFSELRPKKLNAKQFRKFVSSILGMPKDDFVTRNWKEELADYPDVADEIAGESLVKELRPIYDPLRKARNSLAHGNGSIKYAELQKNIPNIRACVQFLNQ